MKKYRPTEFTDLFGTSTFIEYIDKIDNIKNIPKTLLFYGESGTGKTTCSRLLAAKLLNLDKDETENILVKGNINKLNYMEINASSQNGVVAAREIEKEIMQTDSAINDGPYIFVLTEAHRLTSEAQDTLLDIFEKVSEEVFSDVYVILTTTNTNKFASSLLRRFTQYEFTNLGYDEMVRFINIFTKENNLTTVPTHLYKQFFDNSKGSPGKIISLLISFNSNGKLIVETDEVETRVGTIYAEIIKISKNQLLYPDSNIYIEELMSMITHIIKITGSADIVKLKLLYLIRNVLQNASTQKKLNFENIELFQKWLEILTPEIPHTSSSEFEFLQRILNMIIIRTKLFTTKG